MFVDMHIHEKIFSPDSCISIEDIVDIARKRGLGAVCITDHDNMGFYELADAYSSKLNFPIFTGIEYYSDFGDITAWAHDLNRQKFEMHGSAEKFVDLVHSLNGFCVACHPYRNNNRGLGDNIRSVSVDGVEVLNGSTDKLSNQKAYQICKECNLKTIGASDAHITDNIAKYVTYIPETVKTLDEFIEVLKFSEDIKPAYWNADHYEIADFLERNFSVQKNLKKMK